MFIYTLSFVSWIGKITIFTKNDTFCQQLALVLLVSVFPVFRV